VLVLEVLKQGLPLSGYRQRHRNHAASLRLRSGTVCSNEPNRRCTAALVITKGNYLRQIRKAPAGVGKPE